MLRGLLTPLVLLGCTGVAIADESPPPPVEPTVPATDPPELAALYQQAFTDFAADRFTEAATAFDEVAARSVEPARQLTAAEMARQARALVPTEVAVEPPSETPAEVPIITTTPESRNGRYAMLASMGVLGLALYGPTMLFVADPDDEKAAVGLYMLGAGGSFFAGYLATRDRDVSWAMTDAWLYGSTRGAAHGFAAAALIEGDDVDEQSGLAAASLGSVVEGTAMTLWTHNKGASTGDTNAISKGGDFGGLFGLGLSYALLPEDGTDHSRAFAGAALVGSGVGLAAGYQYANHRELTWGDGEVLRSTAMVGAYAAYVPLVLGEVDSDHGTVAALMVGGALGLVAGDRLLRDRDFSAGQGIVTELSPIAGGLVGAGLGYLIAPRDDTYNDGRTDTTSEKVVIMGGAIGAVGGFALAYLGLDTKVARPSAAPPVSFQLVPTVSSGHRGLSVAGTF